LRDLISENPELIDEGAKGWLCKRAINMFAASSLAPGDCVLALSRDGFPIACSPCQRTNDIKRMKKVFFFFKRQTEIEERREKRSLEMSIRGQWVHRGMFFNLDNMKEAQLA
jgi:hypothetical protein